jgi:hypothetical protein
MWQRRVPLPGHSSRVGGSEVKRSWPVIIGTPLCLLACGDLFLTKFDDARGKSESGGNAGSGGQPVNGTGGIGGSGGNPSSGGDDAGSGTGGAPVVETVCTSVDECPKPPDCREAACVDGHCATTSAKDTTTCGEPNHECRSGKCISRCANGTTDGSETGIDCGGKDCDPCADGLLCGGNDDCEHHLCILAHSSPPKLRCSGECYEDGKKNGGEGGVDCGAKCSDQCALGSVCDVDGDCSSNLCVNGVCCGTPCKGPCLTCELGTGACVAVPEGDPAPLCPEPSSTCHGGLCSNCTNGNFDDKLGETGVDCGGSVCSPCAVGATCNQGGDCESCLCEGSTCVAKRCNDHQKDGCESDIDCGGGCGPCGLGQACNLKSDCASASCSGGKCVRP